MMPPRDEQEKPPRGRIPPGATYYKSGLWHRVGRFGRDFWWDGEWLLSTGNRKPVTPMQYADL